jgi:glycosyltransferase involved in cell wall biosynthesis
MHVAIYHNNLWAKQKGVVFSQVYELAKLRGVDASFIQIAETEIGRVGLSDIDLSYHQYPFRLLFRGAYENASRVRLIISVVKDIVSHPSDLAVLPGYHRIEYWAMLLALMVLNRKRAVFCDSTDFDQPKSRLKDPLKDLAKRMFFRRCHGYFCYGIRSKDYLLKYGVQESKIIYRYQAAALPPGYKSSDVLARYEASPAIMGHRFLYVGRLSAEKGLWDLLNAFAELRRQRTDARLDMVGTGPLRAKLLERVKQLELEECVFCLGPKNLAEITPLFYASTALILPSHSDPWGLVVYEALSFGCPVVVSDVCGCVPALVVEGVTGYSFRKADVAGLTRAMNAVIVLAADRVAAAGRCLDGISAFTPQHVAKQILDGCEQLVGQAPRNQ